MARFQPGTSGNPNGRPSGSGYQQRLRNAVGDRFDSLVDTVLNQALAGDMSAASLLLSRMVPPMRPTQDPQPFTMRGETLTQKAESILDAASEGELSVVDAKQILDALGGVVKVQDSEQTARQLEQIAAILKAEKGAKKK